MDKVEFDFSRVERQIERLEEIERQRESLQNVEFAEIRRLAAQAWTGENGQEFGGLLLLQQEKMEQLSEKLHEARLLLEEAYLKAQRMEEQAEEAVENPCY